MRWVATRVPFHLNVEAVILLRFVFLAALCAHSAPSSSLHAREAFPTRVQPGPLRDPADFRRLPDAAHAAPRGAGGCKTAHGTHKGPRRAATLFPKHQAGTSSFGKRCRGQACDIGKSRARGRTALKASRRAERGQGAVCAAEGVGYRGAAAVVALNEQLPSCLGACMAPCFCSETYSARRVDMILFKIKC